MDPKIADESTCSKSVRIHEKFGHSTFSSEKSYKLHCFQTPPARSRRVRNPFEPIIEERLHTHISSPSVFKVVEKPTDFKWPIDFISEWKPVEIDEHRTMEQFKTPERDSALESATQSRIDSYFSTKEIVPSPYAEELVRSPLVKGPIRTASPVKMCDDSAQTVLSLPPVLPSQLEEALRPYFTYTHNQQSPDMAENSQLYRQLFHLDEVAGNVSRESSPPKSICLSLSPIQFSPVNANDVDNVRSMCTPPADDKLKDCTLSPIMLSPLRSENKGGLSYSSQMSIDSSFGVPDVCDLPRDDKSLPLDVMKSPTELYGSNTNWDIEYRQVTLANSSTDEMDVSNSNTPRSKIFSSQRKKLSDSFKEERISDDEDELEERVENADDERMISENSTWRPSHLIASTPTKTKTM